MNRRNYIQASLCDCKCGAMARYQYRIPLHWVECPMCNAHTQKYRDAMGEVFDMDARDMAVNEWNRTVTTGV